MKKGNINKGIIILFIAILINFSVYLVINKIGIKKINEFLVSNLNIEIEEVDALREESKIAKEKDEKSLNSKLKIHYIDVGQGDAILIENNAHFMLIDAGPTSSKETLQKYLEQNNVKTIDYLVATHNHEDHIGGISNIIKKFDIKEIIASKEISTTKTYENFVIAAKEKKLKFYAPKVLEEFSLGDAKFQILANGENTYDSVNNHSIVIKLIFGNNKFIFMGDAEKELENDILNQKIDVSADVIKLGHHRFIYFKLKTFYRGS